MSDPVSSAGQPNRPHAPFDAATKRLVEIDPAAWAAWLDGVDAPVEVVSAELTTVSAEADRVLRVNAAEPWLLHIEFQSSLDPTLPERLHRYNALLSYHHGVAVHSVAVLLRPRADAAILTGQFERRLPGRGSYLDFRYEVVRLWREPVERILRSGLGTLPLAPLADLGAMPLPTVVRRMRCRIEVEAAPAAAMQLWEATFLLMGLRHPPGEVRHMLDLLPLVRDSASVQVLLEEGRAEGMRRLLLRQGERRFGPADDATRAALNAVADLDALDALADRMLTVASWAELLEGTSSGEPAG